LLLSVVRRGSIDPLTEIEQRLAPIQYGMQRAYEAGRFPEAMTTIADDPWDEIARVARERNCERMLVGLTQLGDGSTIERLEDLLNAVECDLSILRAPPEWQLSDVRNILVPVGGHGKHDQLRARLLASLGRIEGCNVHFLRVVNSKTSESECRVLKRSLERRAAVEVATDFKVSIVVSDDVKATIIDHVSACDLVVLGLQRSDQQRKAFGKFSLDLALETKTAMVMLGGRDTRTFVWLPYGASSHLGRVTRP